MKDLETTIQDNVKAALTEDIGSGDLTAGLIPVNTKASARLICREAAVLCGQPWFQEVFFQVDPTTSIIWHAADGDRIAAGQAICIVSGSARSILTAERCALNFLQTLSATATVSRAYADAVAGTNSKVLDTRKTLPGLRLAQKYAVACGGCKNHRMGLYDAILIKENHIRSAGSISAAVSRARQQSARVPVEVEIETLEQLDEALAAGPDVIMLDNFNNADTRSAVRRNHELGSPARLEASGNVALDSVRSIAETGVDYISVGGLTKHVRAIDLSLQFVMAD